MSDKLIENAKDILKVISVDFDECGDNECPQCEHNRNVKDWVEKAILSYESNRQAVRELVEGLKAVKSEIDDCAQPSDWDSYKSICALIAKHGDSHDR